MPEFKKGDVVTRKKGCLGVPWRSSFVVELVVESSIGKYIRLEGVSGRWNPGYFEHASWENE